MQCLVGFNEKQEIVVALVTPFGLIERLRFTDWDAFENFYFFLGVFREQNRTQVPKVFENSFKEKLNGKSNP